MPGAAMSIEEPAFTVDLKAEHYEIRKYSANIVAETKIESEFEDAGNRAFRILASYIFGNNTSKSKIAMAAPVTQKVSNEPISQPTSEKVSMTAPVSQVKTTGGYLVQFAMPNQYTLDSVPKPNDLRVKIIQVPECKMAVYKYSGSWSQSRFEDNLKEFKSDLAKDKILTIGEPIFARFNSPYQLWFLRRNEIWLQIAK